ncbi:class I SAM-dependent methyltransferase [Ornithinimicrobium sp. Arc0846-15]|nr:class I SAM-dependent methyltransferase [Ornithinimicrobium laminariae]
MSDQTPSFPPPTVPAEVAPRLRAGLIAANYTVDGLDEILGDRASAALHRGQPLLALRQVRESAQPAATLARLWVFNDPVAGEDLETALPQVSADELVDAGLVLLVDGQFVGTCDLRPYGEETSQWWVVSDLGENVVDGPLPTSHVLGVGGASSTLASWTPRPGVVKALDIGTGCGVQSLHLAAHTQSIVATDLSQRALAYAQITGALSGLSLDLRLGSLFEPVGDEQFDLVVSNPPYVITPRRDGVALYEYRDGGMVGDGIVQHLVENMADRLKPGGIAQLMGNWETGPGVSGGDKWQTRVSGWVEGSGLDAWIIQRQTQDTAEYAETWARDGGHRPGTAEFEQVYVDWLADFAERGVEEIGFGIITLQKPADDRPAWFSAEAIGHQVASPVGPTILAGLRARSWLAHHDDAEVLSVPWSVASDVTEERTFIPGESDPSAIILRQGGGLRRAIQLDTVMAGLVSALDGELTPDQLISGIALLTEVDADAAKASAMPVLRGLIADGLLT